MEELQIKNMVCPRCIMAVENLLFDKHIAFEKVVLGKAILLQKPSEKQLEELEADLMRMGFEILQDKDVQRIEKIKASLHQVLQSGEIPSGFNLMDYIKSILNEDYSKLSHLFSSMEGITIEKFFIELKIDKVKEWLFYEEMNLSEISYKLDYSSVQHLSSQFKKVTGMTPSDYKKMIKKSPEGWR
ncbi:DNA-binding domain-containing protein, AraC-type [Belliella baltica DSM 15883]|uniref:DNA-binding domain-containing protein, AraC-type n=1 Tax=Belliella baltica (strain DSM 15883 / CIP 108006 / LMG 21964 / BA134) TaxID=866536 RepID=I3Z0W3_BELBD|nr:AraC family transcriptional regulator [Belliella baltica]AFL82881.1 DNA-binding domain-containing protein, AraC-type [Belliella baltica DSM 15883]